MSKKLRTAVIGCGKVGHFHAEAYEKCENSEFVAVCDINQALAEAFAKQYNVKAYTSVEKMILEMKVETVSICTPHPMHASPAIEAANLGVNLIIEKPLATSIKDCDDILSAAQKSGVKVATICQRRYYPPCLRMKRAIDEGKIGKPILGDVTMLGWRDMAYYRSDKWRGTWKGEGGGVLVNQAPHQLDLLLWYMGEIDHVYGIWSNLNHPELEVDDTAVAVIRFKNGGIGNILVSNSQNPALYGKVHIHGENGASIGVQTDGGAMFIAGVTTITEPPVNDIWTVAGEADMLEKWKKEDADFFNSVDNIYYFHCEQIHSILNDIIDNREPLVSGEDGRRTVELFTAIYRSTATGMPVKFPLETEYI